VVGIDISEASLAHERKLKERHGLDNLTLQRMRVEDAAGLGATFDLIESSGVLHHLPDPAAGLKALAPLLAPDGAVYVMLYGKYGRAGIYMAQELFRILGLQQTPQDVAAVKAALAAFPPDHVLRRVLAGPNDLAFDAGVVDTFLHPIDRGYSVRDCYELLDAAGLVLQGWLNRYAYDPASRIPQGELRERVLRLPEREALAALELIDGRMATHTFHACRPQAQFRVDFDGAGFMDLVPVRRPGWPKFMGLPVELRERRAAVASQIDGRRTVRECFFAAGSQFEAPQFVASFCRDLFRQLWLAGYCDLVKET
jgi:SAM-dependent methyltransferase